MIYGDLIRVIKEPSTKNKPLPFEERLIEYQDHYNKNYGFKDNNIVIPDTLAKLQEGYRHDLLHINALTEEKKNKQIQFSKRLVGVLITCWQLV